MESEIKYSTKCKELMIKELENLIKKHNNFIVMEYFGLTSNDLNDLRRDIKKSGSKYFVVKTRLAKKALENLKLKEMSDIITGGIGISFIEGDVAKLSKILTDYSAKKEFLKIKSGYIDGKAYDTEKIKRLASLPSKEVLLAIFLTTLQSPISGLVNVLNGVLRNFVYALNAIKEKKEKDSPSPPA